jgi:protein disulfide-isomerase A1
MARASRSRRVCSTLKVSRYGQFVDYNGPRKADGIVAYMTKQSLPAVSEVTAANHAEFIKADKVVAVAYLPSTAAAPAPAFSQAADQHRDDFLFGLVTDKAAIPAGVEVPSIVLYRAFDEPTMAFPYPIADATHEEIGNWVKEMAVPIVDEVGAENYATYAVSGKPLAYLFLDPTDAGKDAAIEMMRPVAQKYRGKINFVWIDAIKFGDHAKALNLNEVKWPAFVIQDLGQQLKYPLDQSAAVTAAAIEELAEGYVKGSLQPSLKSQPIPESQDEPVFELVGKQFDQVVFDDKKDVFVEFYATWCGHCKRLKPIWDQLGEHFSGASDLVIAKMEATENDLPPSLPFRVSGFPTIKFKQAGTRDFIDYDGDRSLESLISFVEENAKTKVESKPVAKNASKADHDHSHEEL